MFSFIELWHESTHFIEKLIWNVTFAICQINIKINNLTVYVSTEPKTNYSDNIQWNVLFFVPEFVILFPKYMSLSYSFFCSRLCLKHKRIISRLKRYFVKYTRRCSNSSIFTWTYAQNCPKWAIYCHSVRGSRYSMWQAFTLMA
jgi:hypothetical protein